VKPVSVRFALLLIAIATIYGAVFSRPEGHLGIAAAFGADNSMHFPGTATLPFARRSALRAAGGIVLEPLFRIELLLGGGKNKLYATFLAGQSPVSKGHAGFLLLLFS